MRGLVCREKENGVVRPEDVLSSISVMDVPIDDQDFLEAMNGLRVTRGNGRIVKEAESHRSAWSRMMARRPHQRKRSTTVFSHHRIDGGCRRACSKTSDIVRLCH